MTKASQSPSIKGRPVNNNPQLVKIAFPKKRVVIDCEADLGIEEYSGVQFVMWADPSVSVIANILSPVSKSDDEITARDADSYFDAIHEIVIDSNIEGLDFSTVDSTIESFDHKSLPWGFVSQVVTLYCAKVITESESLKKMFGLSSSPESSGEDSSSEESQLTPS
jgi:hypothetical protein